MTSAHNPRGAALRLFTAIQLPEEWRARLGTVSRQLGESVPGQLKLVSPSLMHVTLVFMGSQPEGELSAIEGACQKAASQASPFDLAVGSIGVFGSPHGIKSVWAGLGRVPEELIALHRSLVAALDGHHVAFDGKPLMPHITVARSRRDLDRDSSLRLHSAVLSQKIPALPRTRIEAFVLMRSQLAPSGPTYSVVSRYRLGDQDGR